MKYQLKPVHNLVCTTNTMSNSWGYLGKVVIPTKQTPRRIRIRPRHYLIAQNPKSSSSLSIYLSGFHISTSVNRNVRSRTRAQAFWTKSSRSARSSQVWPHHCRGAVEMRRYVSPGSHKFTISVFRFIWPITTDEVALRTRNRSQPPNISRN